MRIVCIADTHGHHWQTLIPPGDVLIHAGDLVNWGNAQELSEALRWFGMHAHPHKVLVAGNHDRLFEENPDEAAALIPPGVTYLQDSGCVIGGVRFWGSPVQPRFCDLAFNRDRGEDIGRHWSMIPPETNVLVTHCPPHGKLDLIGDTEHCGCEMLRARLSEIKIHLHVFGHIHSGYGIDRLAQALLINASVCNDYGRLAHDPIVVDI